MSTADNKRLVRRYFEAVRSADASLPSLLHDDVSWWAPPSSKQGGLHSGKPAVLELMTHGAGLYDAAHPVELAIEQMIAEDQWVRVQLTRDARTAVREHRRYHFAFRVEAGRIREVRERHDTPYAQQKLF